MSKPGEVEPTQVYLLHERRFCIYDSLRLQDSVNLIYASFRIHNVLKYSLCNDAVKRSIVKWEIVCIA